GFAEVFGSDLCVDDGGAEFGYCQQRRPGPHLSDEGPGASLGEAVADLEVGVDGGGGGGDYGEVPDRVTGSRCGDHDVSSSSACMLSGLGRVRRSVSLDRRIGL